MGNTVDQSNNPSDSITADIVRYLVDRPGIGLGSRVLLCGISNTEMIQNLTSLGLLVTCTHEDDAESESLQWVVPEADCCEGNVPREQFDATNSGFDLVIVPATSKHECTSLFARPRMMELAGRLACLRPGGFLILLGKSGSEGRGPVTHSLNCCLRQVSVFPGRNSIRTFGSPIRLRYARRNGQFAISLQIPDQRMSTFEWDVLAMDAAKRLPADCCQNSALPGFKNVNRAA
ncbi:MAG: hypothetical protein O3B13_06970 [Planctomycetota bacterium]|nr:hypothetical protein [Planctomycetota bacterium]MDA1162825.1 hypothetical protein [Planctomycetota bacterium]